MSITINLNINNQEIVNYDTPVRILDGHPIFTWTISKPNLVSVNEQSGEVSDEEDSIQVSYEIRIGNSYSHIGTDSFIGTLARVNISETQEMFWKYHGFPILRGNTYYGQIRVTDENGRISNWYTFSFIYKIVPSILNVRIEPKSPLLSDDIEIKFEESIYNNDDYSLITKWYRNGTHESRFDNLLIIPSSNLNEKDVWTAKVFVYDGYEYSKAYFTNNVRVLKKSVVVSDVFITPLSPNINDILKVNYDVDDEEFREDVNIRWYINNTLFSQFNNENFIRYNFNVGDSVRVEVSSSNNYDFKSSDSISISDNSFFISDILVDGRTNPLDVSSITPNISWKVIQPSNKDVNYISIKVGTFFDADNIYSIILPYEADNFTIPYGILEKGNDYFISIAASDSQIFEDYSYSRIKINGSRWEYSVDNNTGWTLETFFDIKGVESSGQNENQESVSTGVVNDKCHTIKIYDGTYFAEVKIYEDLDNGNVISLVSGDVVDYNIGSVKYGLLTIAGKNDNIKIYFNRVLIIDGSGLFSQSTNIKRLELGVFNTSKLQINYKYFVYTTKGYYLPSESSEYTNLQFHQFMDFDENDVVALKGYSNGRKMFALNPHDDRSSSIYSLLSDNFIKYGTSVRSCSPINKMSKSINNKFVAVAHSKGLINMENYFIGTYDNELLFIDNLGNINSVYPYDNGWELVQTVGYDLSYFDDYGFNINTIGKR